MEIDIDVIRDTYALFTKYEIDIPQEDFDQVYSLRINFQQMLALAKDLAFQISEMQSPLLLELNTGISTFHAELEAFANDYETKGPMVQGITAKEASDRVPFNFSQITNKCNFDFLHNFISFLFF